MPPLRGEAYAQIGIAAIVVLLSIPVVRNMISARQVMNLNYNPLHLVGTYGAFGSVTRPRYEVVVQGTDDNVISANTKWRNYEFKGKPGDPKRMPPQIAPVSSTSGLADVVCSDVELLTIIRGL